MKSKIYDFRFNGLWLGGKAIIKAVDEKAAWNVLKKEWKSLEPLDECVVKEIKDRDGVLYFDSGNY